jgi:phage baseplate assembly protein W
MPTIDEDIKNREFLGQGWAFPLQFSPHGQIALARGERDIEQSIRIILETIPGERVMRPEFGCRAKELLFAPRNAATEGLLVQYVEQALVRWEPRINLLAVNVSNDKAQDGTLLVEIVYDIKATHDRRSIVYPFFIIDEEPR